MDDQIPWLTHEQADEFREESFYSFDELVDLVRDERTPFRLGKHKNTRVGCCRFCRKLLHKGDMFARYGDKDMYLAMCADCWDGLNADACPLNAGERHRTQAGVHLPDSQTDIHDRLLGGT